MRIIAGEFKGRRLVLPADRRVRMTLERVREAWFSILAQELPGATVVDLFAGSGVLGLEALSRGAAHVDFVDVSAASVAAVRRNVAALGVEDRTSIHRTDVLRFVERVDELTYDVAVADPPYTLNLAERLARGFESRAFARILSIEHPATDVLSGDETRRYGDVALTFWYRA